MQIIWEYANTTRICQYYANNVHILCTMQMQCKYADTLQICRCYANMQIMYKYYANTMQICK